MAISRVGASAADGTTITIPGTYQNGDLAIIFAFRGATTAPSLPAGWTSLGTASAGASSYRLGWKLMTSGADTSGTWTNATGLVCHVYRGVATDRTPVIFGAANTATSATVTYSAISAVTGIDSWVAGFAATKTTTSTIETAPTNMTNACNTVGAATEYAGHDSNGAYTAGNGAWPATNVSVTTSAEWRSATCQIIAEHLNINNYQAFKDSATGDTGILSFTERIR